MNSDLVEILGQITELGVGFVGFVAIFLIFARREGHFYPSDSLRIRAIVLPSILVIFGALIPLGLHAFNLPDDRLWPLSSALIGAVGLPIVIHLAWFYRTITYEGEDRLDMVPSLIAWVLGVTSIVACIFNIAELFPQYEAGIYILFLVCLLGVGAVNFIAIAFKQLF